MQHQAFIKRELRHICNSKFIAGSRRIASKQSSFHKSSRQCQSWPRGVYTLS
ncbi:unnamed protein product [Chondrus crispus]|uniref:Uncharacterized protein n=1 Tax=Chondrus crispus TaxID=2769 RepID=R7QMU0_CHOCR|nr:unnamed protein product [Chondrus crispus]CDF39409.1 unnamed protein product [Chondrus crispus]|eukprot:XP_005719320.1 unnamed protein product [Chondrus crispus]